MYCPVTPNPSPRYCYGIALIWLLLSLSWFGCGSHTRSRHTKPLKGYWYTVKKGETLDDVVAKHGANRLDLVELNGIESKQPLHQGQRVFLFGVQRSKSRDKQKVVKRSTKQTKTQRQLPLSKQKWIWPVRGARLTSKFGRRGNRPHKGIDLADKPGTPIYASADGTVVYSGSRQRGYGNLVILKHENDYVTVYAHNRRNLVDEGQRVRQGFQIAELGNTGRSTGPHLHFEIRHKGKPINPLRLLGKAPKR